MNYPTITKKNVFEINEPVNKNVRQGKKVKHKVQEGHYLEWLHRWDKYQEEWSWVGIY